MLGVCPVPKEQGMASTKVGKDDYLIKLPDRLATLPNDGCIGASLASDEISYIKMPPPFKYP